MKKLLALFLFFTMRERRYKFYDVTDAEAFAVYYGGFAEPENDYYIVKI
jgi:hypothetical protein